MSKLIEISNLYSILCKISMLKNPSSTLMLLSSDDLILLKLFLTIILSSIKRSKRSGLGCSLSNHSIQSTSVVIRNLAIAISDSEKELICDRLKSMSLTDLEVGCYLLRVFLKRT